ncbi:CCR4-NOT regulatory complex component [Basidiobolus ranarum]|uniref:CCR4-NOT regulatory complex component n=1 Tax=Basidiobolus ranarum TaxID=34480 RepID=A0ABR2WI57_9FUNG
MELDYVSPTPYNNKRRCLHDEYVTLEYHSQYSSIPNSIDVLPMETAENTGVWVHNLAFTSMMDPWKQILKNVNFKLESGSRCVLLGGNSEEKDLFLRILAGKHMVKNGSVKVFGKDAFSTGGNTVAYLNSEWLSNPLIQRDLLVGELIHHLGGDRYPDRRDLLLNVLSVSQNWHMHRISSSERLRVQIVLRLLQPWHVLLIEEESLPVEKDTLAILLKVLKWETEERGAIVIYSGTHIQDLISWSTHFACLEGGQMVEFHDQESALNMLNRTTSWQYNSPLVRLLENDVYSQTKLNKCKRRCQT